jgi:hypothetical protein
MASGQSSLKDFQKMDLVELRSLMDDQEEEFDVLSYATEIFSGLVLKVKHSMIVKQSMKPMSFKTVKS